MHIKQLECFVLLAETLNFTRTAQLLYITQPTVTHQINALEDELGLKLFIRTKRTVELTPAGVSFYKDVKDILTRTTIAVAKARNHAKVFQSNLSIGYEGNMEVQYLPLILSKYKDEMPDVHLYLKMADYKQKRTLFTDGKIDVLFTVREMVEGIANTGYIELYVGRFVCVMPKGHRLSCQKTIKVNDLRDQSLILLDPLNCPVEMARVQNNLQLECPDSVVFFSDSALISNTMIKGGVGIAVMPDFVCSRDSDLSMIPLEIPDLISYGIAWNKNGERGEIKQFLRITQAVYAETGACPPGRT